MIYKLIFSLSDPDLFESNIKPLDPTLFMLPTHEPWPDLSEFPFLINGRTVIIIIIGCVCVCVRLCVDYFTRWLSGGWRPECFGTAAAPSHVGSLTRVHYNSVFLSAFSFLLVLLDCSAV